VTPTLARHALVVGGTGMLAEAVRGLVARGWRVSVLARRATAFARREPGVIPLDCDYNDPSSFGSTLDRARDGAGPIALAVGWFHSLGPASALAFRTGAKTEPGRFFHLLGSAVADPARPDRLEKAARSADGAVNCLYRQLMLGFVLEGEAARWLTNAEISAGVLRAIDDDAPAMTLGVIRPWDARPSPGQPD
jgi:hypothetical protein